MRLTKPQTVVVALLWLLNKPTPRTKLVKLVYLLDNMFYEYWGRTLTGLDYVWDEYGPNAVDNAIVTQTNELTDSLLSMRRVITSYFNIGYLYELREPNMQSLPFQISDLEMDFIKEIVTLYGDMNVPQIKAAAKKTAPFRTAKPFERLEMKSHAEMAQQRIRELRRKLDAENIRVTAEIPLSPEDKKVHDELAQDMECVILSAILSEE